MLARWALGPAIAESLGNAVVLSRSAGSPCRQCVNQAVPSCIALEAAGLQRSRTPLLAGAKRAVGQAIVNAVAAKAAAVAVARIFQAPSQAIWLIGPLLVVSWTSGLAHFALVGWVMLPVGSFVIQHAVYWSGP